MPSYSVKYIDKNRRRKTEEILAPSIDEAKEIIEKRAEKIISISKLDNSFVSAVINF